MTLQTFFEKFDQFADAPDAVEKMRELVLRLAMQGKLVSRNPRDKPADSLVVELKAEVGDKNSHRTAPLPPIAPDEIPFELPAGWVWERLGNIGETNIGLTYSPQDVSDVGTPVLRSSNVQNGKLDFDDLIRVTCEPKQSVMVRDGDLLICARNGSRALVGKVALIENLKEPAAFGAFMAIFRSRMNRFLYHFICSPLFRRMIDEVNTTTINQITQNNLRSTLAPIPPLAEQKRIVAKVDELMALCDRLALQQQERETRHAALARASLARFADAPTPANLPFLFHPSYAIPPADLRKSILTLAVQGKLVPQDTNDVAVEDSVRAARKKAGLVVRALAEPASDETSFEVPESWRWVTVADVADARLGKMLDKEKNRGVAHPYLRNTNVHWFRFELESIKTMLFESAELDEYRVESGDVLICEGGHGIARSAVWDSQIPGIMFQKALHRVRPLSCLNGHFLTFCLWVYERDEILQRYYTGAGIPHFTGKALARVTFPIPPLAEQRRIVAKVEQLMALVDALETQLAASRATAANLLSALVAELTGTPHDGKVSVPSASTTGRRGRPRKSP